MRPSDVAVDASDADLDARRNGDGAAAGPITVVLRSGRSIDGCEPYFEDLDGDRHPLGPGDDGLGLSRLFRADRVVLRRGQDSIHIRADEIAAVKVRGA